jgi:hypothetical protein
MDEAADAVEVAKREKMRAVGYLGDLVDRAHRIEAAQAKLDAAYAEYTASVNTFQKLKERVARA